MPTTTGTLLRSPIIPFSGNLGAVPAQAPFPCRQNPAVLEQLNQSDAIVEQLLRAKNLAVSEILTNCDRSVLVTGNVDERVFSVVATKKGLLAKFVGGLGTVQLDDPAAITRVLSKVSDLRVSLEAQLGSPYGTIAPVQNHLLSLGLELAYFGRVKVSRASLDSNGKKLSAELPQRIFVAVATPLGQPKREALANGYATIAVGSTASSVRLCRATFHSLERHNHRELTAVAPNGNFAFFYDVKYYSQMVVSLGKVVVSDELQSQRYYVEWDDKAGRLGRQPLTEALEADSRDSL